VLAFFGRLETRKGLDLFLRALRRLSQDVRKRIKEVHFVGKVGEVGGEAGDEIIRREMAQLGLNFHIQTELDASQAIDYLKGIRATVIVPSLMDNYPFTVLETISVGLPVQASAVGGIPEILGEENTFRADQVALASRIERLLDGQLAPVHCRYSPEGREKAWVDALRGIPAPNMNTLPSDNLPLVSICIPHFNYGAYLPAMLHSIEGQNYYNIEVIVVDDGSTDSESLNAFNALSARNTKTKWRFINQKNQGIGSARNAAAKEASGEYIIFVDADNLVRAEMVSTFVEGMIRTDAAILTCHFCAFSEDVTPKSAKDIIYTYAPVGPAIAAGWRRNVFGDANFCIKKSVFESLGGFSTQRDASWEDWEFLARAALAGYKMDVIPEPLFWYRHTLAGASRNTNLVKNQRRVMDAYLSAAPALYRPIIACMSQVGFTADLHTRTPAGEIAGKIADRIYAAFGSPTGPVARWLERFFQRVLR